MLACNTLTLGLYACTYTWVRKFTFLFWFYIYLKFSVCWYVKRVHVINSAYNVDRGPIQYMVTVTACQSIHPTAFIWYHYHMWWTAAFGSAYAFLHRKILFICFLMLSKFHIIGLSYTLHHEHFVRLPFFILKCKRTPLPKAKIVNFMLFACINAYILHNDDVN